MKPVRPAGAGYHHCAWPPAAGSRLHR